MSSTTPPASPPSRPQRLAWPDQLPPANTLALALGELARGALVVLPTETVYGIAARADDARAAAALAALKGHESYRPWTWHVGSHAPLRHFPSLGPLVERLGRRYWPGPLTLVLRGLVPGLERCAHEGWTGLRFPAQRATAALLASAPFPVVMTSANLAGKPPAVDVADLENLLSAPAAQAISLIAEGGRARLGEASSVLRVGVGHFELLREGLHSLADLRRTAGLRLAFVCTGNTCRSPMSAALAQQLLGQRLGVRAQHIGDFGFELLSRGLHAASGSGASEHAQIAMRERKLDLAGHVSTQAEVDELVGMDQIYCMTRNQLEALRAELLPLQPKLCIELLDPAGEDLPDPYGGSLAEYRACAARILSLLERRIDSWA